MPVRLTAIVYDALDPGRLARFWADLLGRTVVADATGPLLPGPGAEVGLRFVAADTSKVGRDRTHLHVTSASDQAQAATVERALALGAKHLDVGQSPAEGHVVLADPGGNEFCVIEAGNAYLAGTGRLGELAGDGGRPVGVFWSSALGWPLVWDQDQETAIQSPDGGTKVAWGGPSVEPRLTRNRQRLELAVAAGELAAEVDRLVSLGARLLGTGPGGIVELADPEGNEFDLRPTR